MSIANANPSPAEPALHFATPLLHNATLCYTPATPVASPHPGVNVDQLSTCIIEAPPACYTPPITFAPANPAAFLSFDSTSTCAPSAPPDTSAACSTIPQPLLELTSAQRRALDLLQAGHSVAATARRLNVHRVTVQRWKTHHPRFIAELAYRSGVSRFDTSLKAQRALDLAINYLIKQLATSPRDAQQIALRIISSPRLSRLATTSIPTSLHGAITQLRHLRNAESSADSASPEPLADLLTELDAPIPDDLPKPDKPRPHTAKPSPWAQQPSKPPLSEVLANRTPRPDLLKVLMDYGCTREQADLTARRPDIAPFDIHYFAMGMEIPGQPPSPHLPGALTHEGNLDGIGVDRPLGPARLVRMISHGLLPRIAGHDLAGYTASSAPDGSSLALQHPGKPAITIPRDQLWRDAVLP